MCKCLVIFDYHFVIALFWHSLCLFIIGHVAQLDRVTSDKGWVPGSNPGLV